MSNTRVIGCTVADIYSDCRDCKFKSSPVGCIQYRNTFNAVETMGVPA